MAMGKCMVFVLMVFSYLINDTTEDNSQAVVKISPALLSIEAVAKQMTLAGKIPGSKRGKSVDGIAAKMDKAKQFGTALDTNTADRDKAAAVTGVASGLGKLVKGIHDGDWQSIVTGGLGILATLTSLIDNPKFKMITSVLNILSTVFGLFGGSTGGKESTEDLMKSVIAKALLESKSDELKAEFFGLKRLYGSLSNSMRAFRDGKNVSDEQSNQFYTNAFIGVRFFGIVENYIDKWCEVGETGTDSTPAQKNELQNKANRCLEFCNLYADLSLLRQILLADMASLLLEINRTETSTTLLRLLSQEQEEDKNIYKFFAEPINYRKRRYVIAQFYAGIEKYPTLSAYLITLQKSSEKENKTFIEPSVMFCRGLGLTGDCYSESTAKDIPRYYAWNDKLISLYVSAGKQVYGYEHQNYNENRNGLRYGPYYGPAIYGKIPTGNPSGTSSVKIMNSTINAGDLLRVCEEADFKVTGSCQLFDVGTYRDLRTPFKIGEEWKGPSWNNRIKSISIPAGMKITASTNTNNNGGTRLGPYYGPQIMNNVCHEGMWSYLKIERTETVRTQMIKICRGEGLSGFCDDISVPEDLVPKTHDIKDNVNGCNWNDANKMKSMKIPGGVKVEVFSGSKTEALADKQIYGPYYGPTTISRVDGVIDNNQYINSIIITKLY